MILTFLGKGGSGRSAIALATAYQLSQAGKRVLLTTQDPTTELLLETPIRLEPTSISSNFWAVNIRATALLEQSWEEVKKLEAQYVRFPLLGNVYGQELAVLPGMDQALALNALREYYESGNYDVIIFDGAGDLTTLRMFAIPEHLSWYIRRFRDLFLNSDLGKTISPFIQPISNAVLNVTWTAEDLTDNPNASEANQMLERGKTALEQGKVAAYLVTTDDPYALKTAKFLWGSAQQSGLRVAGVLLNQETTVREVVNEEFTPLPITSLPPIDPGEWMALGNALPDLLGTISQAPPTVEIDRNQRTVKVFLPGFSKQQVKLSQPKHQQEITIDAGDQRRNIPLPPPLRGQPVTGAKFLEDGHLLVSF
ncbi:ArsA family ATPase [Euhalothece natronophila Z-M001]|uniref:ArsA family ATPase n=2 Tax=Euhalothece TaxID=65097 RepID=A0A5B8NKA3_9CHRO|nr:ArsA family ATPase [Euhalothece natronophila Z-M001]